VQGALEQQIAEHERRRRRSYQKKNSYREPPLTIRVRKQAKDNHVENLPKRPSGFVECRETSQNGDFNYPLEKKGKTNWGGVFGCMGKKGGVRKKKSIKNRLGGGQQEEGEGTFLLVVGHQGESFMAERKGEKGTIIGREGGGNRKKGQTGHVRLSEGE